MKHNSITQSDMNLDFAGMKGDGVNRGTNKFAGNMHSGIQNPNKLFNCDRGPTVGNKSDDDRSYPDAAALPKFTQGNKMTPGKDMFPGSANPQVRTSGGGRFPGTTAMPKTGKDMFNFGRGPTKGNQL